MRVSFKNTLLFTLLVISYFLFSYYIFNRWWYSSIGSGLLIFLSYLIWGKDYVKQIGLQISIQEFAKSIFLAALITACALVILSHIGNRENIQIEISNWRDYYHVIFYVLNEEIVLGAILLFSLVNKWKIKPIVASLILSVFFALLHYAFYRWIFLEKGIIEISTLTTLFFVGFVRNSLILITGHIGYSWALHFGWVSIMFGSVHTTVETNFRVSETDSFNMYLGSTEMLIISSIMAVFILLYWIKGYFPKHANQIDKEIS